MISEYKVGNKVFIDGAVQFNFWRALTDNDKGWKVDQKMGVWENEGERYKLLSLQINETDSNAIEIKSSYWFEATKSMTVLLHTSGRRKMPTGVISGG